MAIPKLNETMMEAARQRLNCLAKPPESLGWLEEYAVRLAGIRGRIGGVLKRRAVIVFAADNGVHRQHVTSVPQSATAAQAALIANGKAGGAVLAKAAGATIDVYNIGCATAVPNRLVRGKPIMHGTDDMTLGPAMSVEQMNSAIRAGASAVDEHSKADVLGVGETGVCNTTTAAAVTSRLLDLDPQLTVGPGAGISGHEYDRKLEAVAEAISVNWPDAANPLEVIQKIGGLDIAAMTGAFLRAARLQIPAVIDGYTSACAALCAVRLSPDVRGFLFASHWSPEPGFAHIMSELNLHPPLNLELRLGEGSGCTLMFQILQSALTIIGDMGTQNEAGAPQPEPEDDEKTDGKQDVAKFPDLRIDS